MTLSGADLATAFRAAADHLAAVASSIDAINVYPVPDGDTGSNMAATLRAAVAGIQDESTATVVLQALARAALYGARGNSGVILSQALRGLAEGWTDAAGTVGTLQRALTLAADAAYSAMSVPQEGTMLTVLRAAAQSATGDDCLGALQGALAGAEAAEANTINQIDRLREAGVTDAGGEGICAILRAVVASFSGVPQPAVETSNIPLARLVDHGAEYGFCTEFLIEAQGTALEIAHVRSEIEGDGNPSAIVVGDSALVRVHVHTDDPERVIRQAGAFGSVTAIKVEDMGAQNRAMRREQRNRTGLAVLALCEGEGLARAFESLGATVLQQHGSQRPSVNQVVDALADLGAEDCIILPNHKDLVPVARQAVELWSGSATVVPSRTLPQGLAALVARDDSAESAETATNMEAALASVTTIECTFATESRVADGVAISRGDVVVLVDGKVVAATKSLTEGLIAGLAEAGTDGDSLVTLYSGSSLTESDEDGLRDAIVAAVPDGELEVVRGGQALYPVIASVE